MLYDNSKFDVAYNISKLKFIYKEIEKIKNIKILELGVRDGFSTSLFLKLCEDNNGKMISIDIDDCSHLYQNKRWKFIQTRDDNFEKIDKEITDMGGLDMIYIDSFHEPNHVKKILYHYYKILNKGGFIFIDDICWLPYAKSSKLANSWNYEANIKTFEKLLEIKFNNNNKINIEFSFDNSGTAKITKKTNEILNEPKKVSQTFFIRNFCSSLYKRIANFYK